LKACPIPPFAVWRVWRYQRGNQNLYIEVEQTTQRPKEKRQKDKQRSTKHTHKIKDRVIRTTLKNGGELKCSGRVGSSCSTSGTRRVNLITNLVNFNAPFFPPPPHFLVYLQSFLPHFHVPSKTLPHKATFRLTPTPMGSNNIVFDFFGICKDAII
jgi:hypothetical protein